MRLSLPSPRRCALAAGVVLLVPLPALAHAATPGKNGSIVFMRFAGVREDDHTAQLVVRSPAGQERQITHLSGGAFHPQVSPDGKRIVFERWASAKRLPDQLYTSNLDGSGARPLVSGCTSETGCLSDDEPAWSPDGSQIAFVRYALPLVKVGGEQVPSAADLMLVPATGGAPRVLRHFAGDPLPDHPAWSPDGSRLVFPLSTGQHPTKQTPFLQALNVLDVEGGTLRQITPLSLGASEPDWSPDGKRILFTSEGGHSEFAYVVQPDGTGLRRLSHSVRNHSSRSDDVRRVQQLTIGAHWSPDGKRITYVSDAAACGSRHIDGCPHGERPRGVWVMNANGSGAHRLTHGKRDEAAPAWAPAA